MDKEQMKAIVKRFVFHNMHLLDRYQFQTLYSLVALETDHSNFSTAMLTQLLLDCGIKPDDYMKILPPSYARDLPLDSYTISKGVTTISKNAFFWCDKLTSIDIPDSVTTIGHEAFSHCLNLQRVVISKHVKTIEDKAFHYCNSLKDISFKGTKDEWSRIELGAYAFKSVPTGIIKCSDGTTKLRH